MSFLSISNELLSFHFISNINNRITFFSLVKNINTTLINSSFNHKSFIIITKQGEIFINFKRHIKDIQVK